MKRLLLGLLATCLLGVAPGAKAAIALVQHPTMVHFASVTSTSLAFVSNVTAGDGIVVMVALHDNETLTVTDTLTNTILTAQALAGSTSRYVAFYYVQSSLGGADTVNISWATSSSGLLAIAEYSHGGIGLVFDAAATIATGLGTTITSNSVTPSVSGELAAGFFGMGLGTVNNAWTNGFTQRDSVSGVTISGGWADQVLSTAAAISTGDTTTSSQNWTMGLALFKEASGPSCTHDAWLQSGATPAVPTAGSTIVWRKGGATDGTFGSVDCSSVTYYQPGNGNGAVGVN